MDNNIDYTFELRLWAREYTKIYQVGGRDKAGRYLVENVPKGYWQELRPWIEKEFEKRGVVSKKQINPHEQGPDEYA